MKEQFYAALRTLGATEEPRLFEELLTRYQEPHRAYHTLSHVTACLGWLEWSWALAERPNEILVALWYHDAVYEPRASDNEEQSAALARERLSGCGADPTAVDRVARLVMATRDHVGASRDEQLIVDIDLAILGARPALFDAYDHGIRSEYAHVPAPLYAFGRRRVLRRFLESPVLYQTAPLRETLESPARANLTRALRLTRSCPW
ncbi:MAG: N-methyl-D-aspartate receptor NMDAR2C subunit [Myxococcota bacterium]